MGMTPEAARRTCERGHGRRISGKEEGEGALSLLSIVPKINYQ